MLKNIIADQLVAYMKGVLTGRNIILQIEHSS